MAQRPPSTKPLPEAWSEIADAELFEFPTSGEWQQTSYSRLLRRGELFLKCASSKGRVEYEKFIIQEIEDDDMIRPNQAIERFSNLRSLVDKYPAFRSAAARHPPKDVHWLLLHSLQHDRLNALRVPTPQAKFIFLTKRNLLFGSSIVPALVQRRAEGVCLMDAIDHERISTVSNEESHRLSFVKASWREYVPAIRRQLEPLMTDEIRDHLNWYIPNFVFDANTDKLSYIDMKPSNLFGRWRNNQNLRNLTRDFIEGVLG
jgi:hypothetical protein